MNRDDDSAILSLPFDLDPPSEQELNALAADLEAQLRRALA